VKQYCSSVCCIIDNELAKAQRVCEAVGASPSSSELWAAAAALNDAVTEYHRLHRQLFGGARSVEDAWFAISEAARSIAGHGLPWPRSNHQPSGGAIL
jgi:hypothetical protein